MPAPQLLSPPKAGNSSARVTVHRTLFALALGVALFYLKEVWILAFLAVVVAVVLSFPVNLLLRVMPRGPATLLTLVLGISATLAFAPFFVTPFVEQAHQAEQKIPEAFLKAKSWLRHTEGTEVLRGSDLAKGVEKKTEVLADSIVNSAGPAILRATSFGSAAVALLALALFFVHEPNAYRRWVRALVPREHEEAFDTVWERLGEGLRKWIGGILVSMTLMGGFTAAGLWLAGVQNWLLLGALTFFGTFVPYVGALASAVPGLLVALSQSEKTFVWAGVVYLLVHIVEGYIVEPIVMKRAVTIHPAILLLWQVTMGTLFGLAGFVVATPLYVCVKIALDHLYVERGLAKTPYPPPGGNAKETVERAG